MNTVGISRPRWKRFGGIVNQWKKWEDTGHMDTARQIVALRHRLQQWGFDKKASECENGELIFAALAYLITPGDELWPFEPDSYFPGDPLENVVWAGAFLATEGDRIVTAQQEGRPVSSGLVLLNGLEPEKLVRCVDGLRQIKDEIRGIRDDHSYS